MTNAPCRIAIVDDDQPFRNTIRRLFGSLRHELHTEIAEACDGETAMNLLQNIKIDCMLLDNRMPGEPGINWIPRYMEVQPTLPIIVVTGQGDEGTATQAMKNGAADYLVKGMIDAESLLLAIRGAVAVQEQKAQLRRQAELLRVAETHRLMIAGLGSACRTLADPVATITHGLDILERQRLSESTRDVVANSIKAAHEVATFLKRLSEICELSDRTHSFLVDFTVEPLRRLPL